MKKLAYKLFKKFGIFVLNTTSSTIDVFNKIFTDIPQEPIGVHYKFNSWTKWEKQFAEKDNIRRLNGWDVYYN